MYHTIQEFLDEWRHEAQNTTAVFANLTDDALGQRVTAEGRSIRTLAWHITVSVGEMMTRVGFSIEGPSEHFPEPETAEQIRQAYASAVASLDARVRENWNDESLEIEHDMYGEMWTNATTLRVLVMHEAHHRAQLTVLMRQAGLKVPGIYGPSREDWSSYGMEPHV